MPVPILHFSDALCIFAHVAQARIDELLREFPDDVTVEYRFCQIFGDTQSKIGGGWQERGGFAGYNAHVLGIAARFEHVTLHPEVWARNPPRSSLSAHLFLRAVAVLEDQEQAPRGSLFTALVALRRAFFAEARDVASESEQLALAESLKLDVAALRKAYATGAAHAALAADLDLARKHEVVQSPTLIFNEGRQRLTGNVGYRIIEANVRELLRAPEHEASWC